MQLWVISMLLLELHWSLFFCTSKLLYLSLFIPLTTLLNSDQPTFFQCFVDLYLNQRRLEQDPGLGGPVGGLRRVFINLEIIIFLFANWIQKHSGTMSGNILKITWRLGTKFKESFKWWQFSCMPGPQRPLITGWGLKTLFGNIRPKCPCLKNPSRKQPYTIPHVPVLDSVP